MSSKLTPNRYYTRYSIFFAVGFVLIGVLYWYVYDSIRKNKSQSHADPSLSINQTSGRKPAAAIKLEANSQSNRPLELNLPAIGTIKGARWIRNVDILQHDGKKFPLLDVMVDEAGRFLTARRGDEAFASYPKLDVYWNVLKQQTSNREGLKKRVKSVRNLPLPWPSRDTEDGIVSAGGRGEQTDRIKIHTWVPVAVEFYDDPALHATMISIRSEGTIIEAELNQGIRELLLSPDKHLYDPPVVAGANRFATLVKITTGPIAGLRAPYVGYEPVGFLGVYLTEPWAGLSPWTDEQIDPIYGDRRADESFIPDDIAVSDESIHPSRDWTYSYFRKEDGSVIAPQREEAEARYQARLAREAAEKRK